MPIQMGFSMMFWIVGGLVVLDEIKYYSSSMLAWIFSSFALAALGIFILSLKT